MKKALITGGSSGIGKQLAQLLVQKGFQVTTFSSQECDLRYTSEPIVTAINKEKPTLVINCAGIAFYGDALNLSLEEQKHVLRVNGEAAMEITIAAASMYRANGIPGTILNVSSLAGEIPMPGDAVYGASKAFLTSFSRAIHYELRRYGISVLVSSPGMVETNFKCRAAKKNIETNTQSLNPRLVARLMLRQIEKKIPFQVIDWRCHILYLFFAFIPKRVFLKRIYDKILLRI